MVLQKQTNSGLTYGQIIATVAIIITLLTVAIQSNQRMSEIEIELATQKILITELQKGKEANAQGIKDFNSENKADHKEILVEIKELRKEISNPRR